MPLIDVGRAFPSFSLPDDRGAVRTLKSFVGGPLVIFVYPEDLSPSCTNEACGFRDASAGFGKIGAAVVGLSPDGAERHQKFVTKQSLNFPLLSDEPVGGTPKFLEAIGAWGEKSMYGKKYMGVIRTTYLIDGAGRVARRWDNVRVNGHVDEVLAAATALVTAGSAGGSTGASASGDSSMATGRASTKKSPVTKTPAAKKKASAKSKGSSSAKRPSTSALRRSKPASKKK
jgi:thioredoxin-dependent peroxiredoxin